MPWFPLCLIIFSRYHSNLKLIIPWNYRVLYAKPPYALADWSMCKHSLLCMYKVTELNLYWMAILREPKYKWWLHRAWPLNRGSSFISIILSGKHHFILKKPCNESSITAWSTITRQLLPSILDFIFLPNIPKIKPKCIKHVMAAYSVTTVTRAT